MLGIADRMRQVIRGEFAAYAHRTSLEPYIVIRAVDSRFYEKTSDDPLLLDSMKLAFAPQPTT